MALELIKSTNKVISLGLHSVSREQTYFSLAYWGRRHALAKEIFVGNFSSSSSAYFLEPYTDGNVYVGVYNGQPGNGKAAFDSTDWAHFAMTYYGDGGNKPARLKLYINGVLQVLSFNGSNIGDTTPPLNGDNFVIGGFGATSGRTDADIAEVKIWLRTLTPSEIIQDMNTSFPDSLFQTPAIENLIGYYPCDSEDYATDYSKSDIVGVMNNSPKLVTHPKRLLIEPALSEQQQEFLYATAPAAGGLLRGDSMDGLSSRYFNNSMAGGF